MQHGGWCPDLLGPAIVSFLGHETKKDMSMLFFTACPWPRPGSYGMNKDIKDEK
jgi:hypothetical protein